MQTRNKKKKTSPPGGKGKPISHKHVDLLVLADRTFQFVAPEKAHQSISELALSSVIDNNPEEVNKEQLEDIWFILKFLSGAYKILEADEHLESLDDL